MYPLRRIFGAPEASSRLLAQLHEELCQGSWIIGLLLEGIGVAKAFACKINGIDLMAAEPEIPVVAVDASEDLPFEEGEGSVVEFHRGEDAVGVEPGLVAGVDAA